MPMEGLPKGFSSAVGSLAVALMAAKGINLILKR